jgi:RNA polymerase sigma factor (TIGR02999 family)
LVHEAWLKLAGRGAQAWNDRKHFFSTAAEAMRQILIDLARRKQAQRHGGGCQHVDAGAIQIQSPAPDDQLIELNEALDALALEQPAKAEVVKLKFFGGLREQEIAELLGVTERTVQRYWAYSQVWLLEQIRRH